MLLIEIAAPGFDFSLPGQKSAALALGAVSAAAALVSLVRFFRAGTTIDPTAPEKASALVVDGLYRYSRNPMYLSMLGALIAWGLWLGNPVALIVPAVFAWIITEYQIKPEEAALSARFGVAYEDYQKRVRRWI